MNRQTIMPSILHTGFHRESVRKASSEWGVVKLHGTVIEYFEYCSLFSHLFSLCASGHISMNTIQRALPLNFF